MGAAAFDRPAAPPTAASAGAAAPTHRTPGGVFSCEVFDGAVVRAVGTRAGLYLLFGRRLAADGLIDCSPATFSLARLEAERLAAPEPTTAPPPSLDAIYDHLQFLLGLPPQKTAAIRDREPAFERALTMPVPGMRERLDRARDRGQTVAFLSDAPRDAAALRDLLAAHGLAEAGDVVHSGAETGAGKASGAAFRSLAVDAGVPISSIVHRGADPFSDVAAPARAGAQVEPQLAAGLNRYEAILDARASATDGLGSAMAGAARLARLAVGAANPHRAALRDVSASVGAPALVSYVLWLLLRARKMGFRRLFFLARDGHLLLLIARRLCERLDLDLELRYLYGGRQAWYVPTLADVTPTDAFWAVDYAAPTDLQSFLRRIGIDAAEVETHLEALGMPRSAWLRPVAPAEHERLWQVARREPVRRLVLDRARQRQEAVLGYFRQEGLLESADWALVDIGWSGRLLGAMNSILAAAGGGIPAAFFFARFVDREDHRFRPVEIIPYLGDHTLKRGLRGGMPEIFLELFCGANHGVTLGYRLQDGRFEPVLAGDSHPGLTAWGIDTVHETILAFVEALLLDPELVSPDVDMRRTIADVFRPFVSTPTAQEAAAWGAYPFEYGRNGEIAATLATPLTLRQLPRMLRVGSPRTRAGTEWKEGSLAVTPAPARLVLQAALRLRGGAGRIVRHGAGMLQQARRGLAGLRRRVARP